MGHHSQGLDWSDLLSLYTKPVPRNRTKSYLARAVRFNRHCLSRGSRLTAISPYKPSDNPTHRFHFQMHVTCGNGHRFTVPNKHRHRLEWCPHCVAEHEQERWLKFCKSLATKRGGKLISLNYIDARTPLLWECDQGHRWRASMDNVHGKRSWCKTCACGKSRPGRRKRN